MSNLSVTSALGAGTNRTHVKANFDDIVAWANGTGNIDSSRIANKAVGTTQLGVLPACRLYNNGAISIPNATVTALTFNVEQYDTDSIHSSSSNTGRLTATTAGVYDVFANAVFAASSAGNYRGIAIRINGTNALTVAEAEARPTAGGTLGLSVSSHWSFAAGDYAEVVVIQDSGGALNVLNTGTLLGNGLGPTFGMAFRTKAS